MIPAVTSELKNLSPHQRALLNQWLSGASVERDHSWGLVETTVLEMTHAGSRFIVKAGGDNDHHIERELHAHLNWLGPWSRSGRAPILEHGNAEAKLLVTRYLPGELVLGSEYADVSCPYCRQASCWPCSTPRSPLQTTTTRGAKMRSLWRGSGDHTGSLLPRSSDYGPRSPRGRRRPRLSYPPTGTGSPETGSSTTIS